MSIFDTFSKRQKRLQKAGQQDIYQYDTIPAPFRMQVLHIWKTAIGNYFVPGEFAFDASSSPANEFWAFLHDTLARELGLGVLAGDPYDDPRERCQQFLLKADTSGVLDIVELSFRIIDRKVRGMDKYSASAAEITQDPDSAIEELNHRFREHGIGYQYADGILVRLDSQFAHAEIVTPALSLLNAAGFDGPADEFIRAFDHYRHDRNKEAVAEALKAFESTMKSICKARKWSHPPNATAQPLIKTLFEKGLIPADLESHFSGLRSAMESGLPTIRNRFGGHGQGPEPTTIPPYFAAYALHLLASNIVFLVEAHKALK
jgi:Domain of unknown function (DUF7014)/AbiJ N-terminal domain 4